MFTGLVQGTARVKSIIKKPGLHHLTLQLPQAYSENILQGASIAINGACLTVTHHDQQCVSFDVIQETLSRTNLNDLKENDLVNFERSARFGDEIGGHLVSGHVHDTVEIISIEKPTNNHIIRFKVTEPWLEYIIPKGFITLNGASLTIVDVDKNTESFTVHLIPETLAITNFANKIIGDKINLEIEQQTLLMVNTIKNYLQRKEKD